jgi:hypothetical protein
MEKLTDEERDAWVAERRKRFEAAIAASKVTSGWDLGSLTINGGFSRYTDPETDCAWIGFCWGYDAGLAALSEKDR